MGGVGEDEGEESSPSRPPPPPPPPSTTRELPARFSSRTELAKVRVPRRDFCDGVFGGALRSTSINELRVSLTPRLSGGNLLFFLCGSCSILLVLDAVSGSRGLVFSVPACRACLIADSVMLAAVLWRSTEVLFRLRVSVRTVPLLAPVL